MLRALSWLTRLLLLVIGLAAGIWLPFSFALTASAYSPWPRPCGIKSTHGAVCVFYRVERPLPPGIILFSERIGTEPTAWVMRASTFHTHEPWFKPGDAFLPRFSTVHFRNDVLRIPLWLLAVVCLTWPATSFVIALQKRRRGFDVLPSPGTTARTQSGTPSAPNAGSHHAEGASHRAEGAAP